MSRTLWILLGVGLLFLMSCEGEPSEEKLKETIRSTLAKVYDLDGDIRLLCPDFPCVSSCDNTTCTVVFKAKGESLHREWVVWCYWGMQDTVTSCEPRHLL